MVRRLVFFMRSKIGCRHQCREGGFSLRKIKFRVWDEEINKMTVVDRINFRDEEVEIVTAETKSTEDYYTCSFNDIKLMQYTGYQDEVWTDMYEGDVVDFIDYGFNDNEYNCRGEIIFEDGTWHITNSISTSELFNYDGGAIKVIGNIFENPELISRT